MGGLGRAPETPETPDARGDDADDVASIRSPRAGGSRRRLVALVVVGSVAAIVGLAARDGLRVGDELARGGRVLEGMSLADLEVEGGLEERLEEADTHFAAAQDIASGSRWLSLVDGLPVVDRQVDALRDMADATTQLAGIGRRAVDDLAVSLEEPAPGGPRRIAVLAGMAERVARADDELEAVEVPHHTWLVPPIGGAQDRLRRGLQEAQSLLARADGALRETRALLAGPTRLLVLAASNAEMRAGMGMPLHAGIVTIQDGIIDASGFEATSDLLLDEPVALPPDLDELYGWLDPGREWRNTSSSPDFSAAGPVFAAMAERAGLGSVDGVVAVDVVAMGRLLGQLGAVEVLNVPLREDNVEELLLNAVYLQPDVGRDVRHEALGLVAEAVFTALGERPLSARQLAVALADASAGRHLMAWSRNGSTQRAWRSVGIAGALDPHGLMIAVQNHGGYKLDWYLRPEATIDAERYGARRRVVVELEVQSTAPPDLPEAVAGSPLPDLAFGAYRAFVTFYLPSSATLIELEGQEVLVAGRDGPMVVVATRFDVPAGGAGSVRISFDVPADEPVHLMPAARAHPTVVRVDGERRADASTTRLW